MSRINVGFTVNDGYVKYLAVTLASILANSTPEDDLYFYILNSGNISENSKQKIDSLKKIKNCNIEWTQIDLDVFKNQGVNLREDVTIETNFRFVISSLFPDIHKMIFLDADLIVLSSLNKLNELNMENYYMACCDCSYEFSKEYRQKIGMTGPYYNTGVMLCNLDLWRQDHKEKEFFSNAEMYRPFCVCLDQDILNTTLQQKILPLPMFWNALGYKNQFNSETKIAHWPGRSKPWRTTFAPWWEKYLQYAAMTPFYADIVQEIKTGQDLDIAHEEKNQTTELIKAAYHFKKIKFLKFKYFLKSNFGKKKEKYANKLNELKQQETEILKIVNQPVK